jgi:hypothetical protein
MEDKASEFFKKRGAQYINRLAWDSLKINTLNSQ